MKLFILLFLLCFSNTLHAKEIQSILLHPVFDKYYACAEHHYGQFKGLGDALGTDCYIVKSVKVEGRSWLRRYKNKGHENKDWFSWEESVLSPVSGKIYSIHLNIVENRPGFTGRGIATHIMIKGENGLNVMLYQSQKLTMGLTHKVRYTFSKYFEGVSSWNWFQT